MEELDLETMWTRTTGRYHNYFGRAPHLRTDLTSEEASDGDDLLQFSVQVANRKLIWRLFRVSHNNNTTGATFGSGSQAEVCRSDSKLAFNARRAAACGLISAVSAEVAALNTTPSLLKLFPQGRFMAP